MISKTSTLIESISADQISSMFTELQSRINELQNHLQPKEVTRYIPRAKLCAELDISVQTAINWEKAGHLQPFSIGNRIFYKADQVESAMIALKKIKGTNR